MKLSAAAALFILIGAASNVSAQSPQMTPPQISPMSNGNVCFGTVGGIPQTCSGKVYPSGLSPATDAYLILAIDELRKTNAQLQQLIQSEGNVVTSVNNLSTATTNTQTLWTNQVTTFANVVTAAITDRFNQLPLSILQDEAFKKTIDSLRDDILKSVNDKLEAVKKNP